MTFDSSSAVFTSEAYPGGYQVYSLSTCQSQDMRAGTLNIPIAQDRVLKVDQVGNQLSFILYDANNMVINSFSASNDAFSSVGVTLENIQYVQLVRLSNSKVYLRFTLYRGQEQAFLEAIYDLESQSLISSTKPTWIQMMF